MTHAPTPTHLQHNNMLRYLLTVFIVASAAITCNAFVTPTGRSSAIRCSTFISPTGRSSSTTSLNQSSDDDTSSTVNIALIESGQFSAEGFENVLQSHPFCKMTGVTLSISTVSVATEFTKEDVSSLQNADIACFSTIKGVKSYLSMLDSHINVAEDITDEERRQLPNKPDLVGDIIQGISGAVNEEVGSMPDAGIMAACPNTNTARECLNSGRWISNHIYYPKDMQQAVELKTEAIDSESDKAEEEEEIEDIDLEVWAATIVQAAGDVYERKFWGGGW
jgi:hypothetical protein